MSTPKTTEDALFTELFTPLFRYVLFRVRDRMLAEDLTQSAFLKFLQQTHRPDDPILARRFLFTIARTTLIDYYRVHGKRQTESIEGADIEFASDDRGPEALCMQGEHASIVDELLHTLSNTESQIVLLRMTSQMSYDDIAHVVGTTSQNARQIYSRALLKMKTYLHTNHPEFQYE